MTAPIVASVATPNLASGADSAMPPNGADRNRTVTPPLRPGALLTDEQTVWVRRAVMVMTTVLIVGIAVVIGRIIYLVRAPTTQPVPQPVPQAAATSAGGAVAPFSPSVPLPDMKLTLPAGADIKSVSATGNRLAVWHSLPGGGDGITVYDLATGQIVSRVVVGHEK